MRVPATIQKESVSSVSVSISSVQQEPESAVTARVIGIAMAAGIIGSALLIAGGLDGNRNGFSAERSTPLLAIGSVLLFFGLMYPCSRC